MCSVIFVCVLADELNTLTISRRGATWNILKKNALSVQYNGYLLFTKQAMEILFCVDNNYPERNFKTWKFSIIIAEQEKHYRANLRRLL